MRFFARGMVRIRLLIFGLVLATAPAVLMFAAGAIGQQPKRDRDERIQIDVIFSPGGGCQQRISDEIAKARDSLRVQAYYFTSKPIADAIVAAAKRALMSASSSISHRRSRLTVAGEFFAARAFRSISTRSTPRPITKLSSSTIARSSPARSTSPRQRKRRTPKTC